MRSLIWCLAFVLTVSCSKPPADQKPVVSPIVSELPSSSALGSADLDPIRNAVGERRVVMMGEALHLTSELSRARERLIRNLHESGDFDLLLFEGSPVEFWIAEEEHLSSKATPESAGAFQKTALLGTWQTDEIRSVIDYALKTQAGAGSSDLYVSGYDVQIGQSRRFTQRKNVLETLVSLMKKRDHRLSSSEEESILRLNGLAGCQGRKFPGSDEQYMQAEEGIRVLADVVARAAKSSSNDLHEKMLPLLPKALSYSLEFCREAIENSKNYGEVRDEWASKQFADFFSVLNQKTLVWAHSANVRQAQRKGGQMSFGSYVRGAFADEVFAIHFTVGTGKAVASTDDKGNETPPTEKPLLPIDQISLERKFSALSTRDFFILSKSLPTQFGTEETTRSDLPGGVMTIDPRKDFDGYYFVQTIAAPTLR